MKTYHVPVMLAEVLENLNLKLGGRYIDCNLGGGGHTKEILRRGGKVLGIDVDPEAIAEMERWFNAADKEEDNLLLDPSLRWDDTEALPSPNLTAVQGNFADIGRIAAENNFGEVDGILFDLGLSSHQLETSERGFSFVSDAPLDMRMSPDLQVTAADLVNGLNVGELAELFDKYGEEKFARPIARAIVERRAAKPIGSTKELSEIIQSARPRGVKDHIHPSTRVFQALRIAVNDELNALEAALPQSVELLRPGGRLAVISFHSLEDRIVKNFMKEKEKVGLIKVVTDKPLVPSNQEIVVNPRARSAKMRVAEKINLKVAI